MVRGKEGKGEGTEGGKGRGRGATAPLGYLSRGPEFLVTPLFEIWRIEGIAVGEGIKAVPMNFL